MPSLVRDVIYPDCTGCMLRTDKTGNREAKDEAAVCSCVEDGVCAGHGGEDQTRGLLGDRTKKGC